MAGCGWLTSVISGTFWFYISFGYFIDEYVDIYWSEKFCARSLDVSGGVIIISIISIILTTLNVYENRMITVLSWQLLTMGIAIWLLSLLGAAGIYISLGEAYLKTLDDAMS